MMMEIVRRVYYRNENIWGESSVASTHPNLVQHCLLWSLFFASMYPFITWVLRTFFSYRIRHILKDEKLFKDMVAYCYSLIHHLVVVPLGLIALFKECSMSDDEAKLVDYAVEYSFFAPYVFGYLVGDFIMFVIPAARKGQYEFFLHHAMGILLVVCACLTTPPVVRFQPHMLLLESSSIFFSFAWFFRHFGYEQSFLVSVLEFLFASSFFFFRIVHLSFVLWVLGDILLSEYPVMSVVFIPIFGLQCFWFYKIVTYKKKPKSI